MAGLVPAIVVSDGQHAPIAAMTSREIKVAPAYAYFFSLKFTFRL